MSEIKEKLSKNLSEENKSGKYIDIFLHLKLNMQNNAINCNCENEDKYYCIPCKVTCCSICNLKIHEPHILISMKDYHLNLDKVNQIFDNFFNNLNKSRLITKSDELKKEMNNHIDNFVDEMIEKLNRFRKIKKEEIEKLFNNLETNKNLMNKSIKSIKQNLTEYVKRNKKFFNLDSTGITNDDIINNDINNTYFLLSYDILNITNQGINQIYKDIDTMEEDLQNYLDNQEEDFTKIRTEMDRLLSDIIISENINNEKNVQSPKENKKSKKEEKNEEENDIKNDLNSPSGHFIYTSDELGHEKFDPVNERINKYNKHIDNFKKGMYRMISKTGNLKELEKNIKAYEKRRLKGAESLFSQRDMGQSVLSESFYSQSNINPKKINSEKDICLNNPLIDRYFSYLFLDLYEKNFKVMSKELQSSHADLMIKVNEDEEENDIAKVIEGTNEIQIYEKKNNKIYKIAVKLTKNPYGYVKFPIGCRCLLIGDKLYISGGRDEYNEYANVLIYDRKTKSIKRIMDMRVPRAYHTMIYSEVFSSMMVFGGENENSVEIFDPLTNRWQLLPDLNIPRSNIIYYCDNPRGILYTMFGNEGSILDNKYSDVIEFLDLKNIKEGWNILDYKNKSEIDLKSLMNIYPLNTDLILLYGGVVFRGNSRSVCIFNITKSEITKIHPKILETLRAEAKKSKKLSTIISGLTSKTDSGIISSSSSRAYL